MSAGAFFTGLLALCGQAFEGRVVSNDPADASMAAQRLVMHVREGPDDQMASVPPGIIADTINIPRSVIESLPKERQSVVR